MAVHTYNRHRQGDSETRESIALLEVAFPSSSSSSLAFSCPLRSGCGDDSRTLLGRHWRRGRPGPLDGHVGGLIWSERRGSPRSEASRRPGSSRSRLPVGRHRGGRMGPLSWDHGRPARCPRWNALGTLRHAARSRGDAVAAAAVCVVVAAVVAAVRGGTEGRSHGASDVWANPTKLLMMGPLMALSRGKGLSATTTEGSFGEFEFGRFVTGIQPSLSLTAVFLSQLHKLFDWRVDVHHGLEETSLFADFERVFDQVLKVRGLF
mmetsp:Transcript_21528/g.31846  ORF Transcript_21528/g.31846 Transcript_21528/m.31846 type:complete len:264 (-) Transcript_21528:132-923(-)